MEHSLAKVIFRLTKPLKSIRGWFPKRSTNFYSVLLSKNSPVPITIFCIVCFEAVARVLYDVSNNVRTPQELDFRLITTSKNDFSEIHMTSGQRPKFIVPLFSLDTSKPHWVHLLQAIVNWEREDGRCLQHFLPFTYGPNICFRFGETVRNIILKVTASDVWSTIWLVNGLS